MRQPQAKSRNIGACFLLGDTIAERMWFPAEVCVRENCVGELQ
jgi:hypothetical protein